jgi:hypothetical protein
LVATGLTYHDAVVVATTGTLATATGGTVTYNNGTAGVGATLTTTGSFNLIDTANVQTVGTRILVKDEANLAHNGIYTYANSTAIVRSTDFDQASEITGHDFVFVQQGNIYAGTGWVNIDAVTTVGTDPIEWIQFSGAGTIQAGNGIAVNGTQVNVLTDGTTTAINGSNQVEVKASANLVTPNIGAATGTSLSLTGNVQAATWVLERIDPARFGTPKDRLAMAELQKAATDIVPRKVTVTITAPPKRKAASGA